jgi:hypothetical protein
MYISGAGYAGEKDYRISILIENYGTGGTIVSAEEHLI